MISHSEPGPASRATHFPGTIPARLPRDVPQTLRCYLLLSSHRASPQVQLDRLRAGRDIKREDIHRQPDRRARIRNVHYARNMALDRDAAQHQVDLIVRVAVAPEILDHAQTRLAVRDGRVHVVLLAVLVDTEALEVDHPAGAKLRLHGARDVDGGFAADHAEFALAVLDDVEFDGDDPRDLDGAAEGDFTIALWRWEGGGLVGGGPSIKGVGQ